MKQGHDRVLLNASEGDSVTGTDVQVKPVTGQPALLLERGTDRVIVIADLHLGWEVTLARQGIHVPSQVPRLLEKLQKIIWETAARKVILLGDVKHAVSKVELEEWRYVPEFFDKLVKAVPEVEVVPGNHDGNLEALVPPTVKISKSEGIVQWDSVGLMHGHAWPNPSLLGCKYLVMGHLHPVVAFTDPLGFRITRQVWVRTQTNGRKLAEGVLKHEGVKFVPGADPIKKARDEFKVDIIRAADCIIVPSFNDYLGGQPVNRPLSEEMPNLKEYLGPLLQSGAVELDQGEAYLFDGTFLGKIEQLRQLAR
ncbi:MAG TPA: metallophosphoesterase [Candidatus Binatus sp.]|nr:metallophosphoesterase [Candidatus Binatus sp.]